VNRRKPKTIRHHKQYLVSVKRISALSEVLWLKKQGPFLAPATSISPERKYLHHNFCSTRRDLSALKISRLSPEQFLEIEGCPLNKTTSKKEEKLVLCVHL
jgi:hypothetical protein